ncbi:unnamed protein product [Alopecurus aequalis]
MSTPTGRSFPVEGSRSSTLARCSSHPHDARTVAETLIDELLLEIISRVPASERWRCKLVCNRWLRLTKALPQSLAGFFYTSSCAKRLPELALHFFNVSGNLNVRRPIYLSLEFLADHRRIHLLDSRNGLLLCRLWGDPIQDANKFICAVCNPARQECVRLPVRSQPAGKLVNAHLGFDPAVSSYFHVFLLLEDDVPCISGVDLYSSKTGRWVHKEKGWNQDVCTTDVREETVFLNGYLHFHAYVGAHDNGTVVQYLAAVATDGETWTTISVPTRPTYDDGFIQLSQGCLHYACFETNEDDADDVKLAIYVLEDYESKRWKLKLRVQSADMFGGLVDVDDLDADFDWIAIHPECNVIFFTAGDPKQFMCYNMDLQKAKVMRTLSDGRSPYLPYVPLHRHIELLSLRM